MAHSMAAPPRQRTNNPDDPRRQFGAFLRDWLDAQAGGDEGVLARRLGLTADAVRAWTRGRSGPRFSELNRLAAALCLEDWGGLAAAVARHAHRARRPKK
jgi:hypothetical protein